MYDRSGSVCTSRLLSEIKDHVAERTWGRIRRLHVEDRDHYVIVRGHTTTYYAKQLAIEAALEIARYSARPEIVFEIQVMGQSQPRTATHPPAS